MSFANLKKQNKSITKLTEELTKLNKGSESYKDDRLWSPEKDKSGNGYAVFRFLPAPDGEEVPWVRTFSHGFQGPGGWYIENCPTTIGQKCPVCEANNVLWNSGEDSKKEIARQRKRKLSFTSNVYVISDPAHRENEGKVFLYRYGKKIFDKITECMQPKFEADTPVNPFDFWTGCNFKLKIKTVAGFSNYDSSVFDNPSVLGDFDDQQLEKIWKSEYKLSEFSDTSNYKSYDELKHRFTSVITPGVSTGKASAVEEDAPFKTTTKVEILSNSSSINDEDEDAGEYLKNLLKEQK